MAPESERWQRIEDLYHEAAKLSPAERSRFLAEQCDGDPSIQREVESLLAYHTSAQPFIETTAFEQTARAVARAAAPDPLVGQIVENFRVIEQLGAGGMGVVYKAEDLRLRRFVALKFLPYVSADRAAVERVEREARAASALNHPNVCTIHDIGEHEGRPFIAMELLEGNTLDKEIANGPLPAERVVSVAMQLADALQAAHSIGIVHRDIKPGNLLLNKRGVLKVLDFGVAKIAEQSVEAHASSSASTIVDLTATGAGMGTPAYMSPEQARGEKLEGRSDLFSTGAVLYEMLTGKRAFPGDAPAVIFEAILNRNPAPISELNPEVPTELDAIVSRCLEKDLSRRYQQASELLSDISALNSSAKRSLTAKQPSRGWGPRLLLAILGAFLFVVLTVISVLKWLKPAQPAIDTPATTVAVLPFKPLVPQSRDEVLELGMADTLIGKLSTSRRIVVRPISSVRRYGDLEQDPVQAGREMDVQEVVDGTIERAGDRIRVTVRLLNVSDSRTMWSGHFDERFTDVFGLQDTIAQQVARELAPTLTGAEKGSLAKRYTTNTEAYDLYLKGRFFWNKRTPEATRRAAEYFQQALAQDPNYALAFAGLADCYRTLPITGDEPAWIAFPKAKQAALRALEIDDGLAEAHTSLGYIKFFYDWDWEGSEREHRRALELDPNYAVAHVGYAHLLSNLGRHEEALNQVNLAVELDPVSPYIGALKGMFLYQARQYSQSVEYLQKVLEVDPNFWIAQITLGKDFAQQGRYQDALTALGRAAQFSGGSSEPISVTGYTYAVARQTDKTNNTLKDLRALSQKQYVPPYNVALVHLGLGNSDEALRWLEKAYAEKDVHMIFLAVDPRWDNLRSDARFLDLLRRLRLTQ